MPFRKIFATRMFITTAILFIVSIGLIIGKKHIKKHIENKKSKQSLEINKENNEESKEQVLETKKN